MWPEDIVGNEEHLDAGRRLARDVAGFDFTLGRNDICWCGSGRKYKICHLASDDRKRSAERGSAFGGGQRRGF